MYRAVTVSGWQIAISHAGGPFVMVMTSIQPTCIAPPSGAISTGAIPTVAGDLVRLNVNIACFQVSTPAGKVPASVLRYQDGWIYGGDGSGTGAPELPGLPSTAGGDVTNSCVAGDIVPGGATGAMSCTYTSEIATGEVIQATPNHIDITYTDGDGSHTLYHQNTLTPPGRTTFTQPIGAVITVTVGPDVAFGPAAGSIGLVIAGDAP